MSTAILRRCERTSFFELYVCKIKNSCYPNLVASFPDNYISGSQTFVFTAQYPLRREIATHGTFKLATLRESQKGFFEFLGS
jgi:hypothetical protein